MRETAEARPVNHVIGGDVLEPLRSVSAREGLVPLAARLAEIRSWLADDLGELEAELAITSTDHGDLARQAAAHLLAHPGKRIRPLCVFLAARAGGRPVDSDVVRDLAIAAELVHAATLLHDDVIDQGTERRGAPTARVLYGNPASVLGGDHLLVEALHRVRRCDASGLLGSLLDVIGEMIAAEALQLERRGHFQPDREAYDAVIRGKTAALFRWAMLAGGTVGGLSASQIAALASAGTALGFAFQLVDDALDLSGDPKVIGKDGLLDLREGKLTWPLIIACERAPELSAALAAVADEPTLLDDPHFRAQLRTRLLATGCVEATKTRAHAHADEARRLLGRLPAGPAREALAAVVAVAVERAK